MHNNGPIHAPKTGFSEKAYIVPIHFISIKGKGSVIIQSGAWLEGIFLLAIVQIRPLCQNHSLIITISKPDLDLGIATVDLHKG